MTIPTNTGMQTALSGLEAYQAGINTTGNNIANASTPGYTRQQVVLGESDPLSVQALSRNSGQGAQVGTGVSIDDISRVRDNYLDVQYRAQNASSSYQTTTANELGQVQTALDEPSDASISTALSNLWSDFNTMSDSNTPSSQAQVLSDAQTLISTMQTVSSQMQTVQTQAGDQLSTLVAPNGQLDQDAKQIASLNTQIVQSEQAGQTPNTLLDQRDSLLDDLSSLGNTTTTADANGAVSVTFGGQTLVGTDGTVTLPQASSITSSYGGKLGALANLADTSSGGAIQSLSDQLDGVATGLVSQVNTALGGQFLSGSSVATLALSGTAPAVLSAAGAAGATAAAALSGGTTDQAYATFVDAVGTSVQSAQNAATTAQALVSSVSNQRQSVSGVSLDEEMSNLITFQQGYEASARMMQTMDSVISTLINSVGGSGL